MLLVWRTLIGIAGRYRDGIDLQIIGDEIKKISHLAGRMAIEQGGVDIDAKTA